MVVDLGQEEGWGSSPSTYAPSVSWGLCFKVYILKNAQVMFKDFGLVEFSYL